MTDSKPVDVGSIPTTVANIKRGYCTILLDKKSMGGTKTEQVFVIYNYSSKLDIYFLLMKSFLRTLAPPPPKTDRLSIELPFI